MSIGTSGRIVIEISPEVKQELYQALTEEGRSLKSWFLENVSQYLDETPQLQLELAGQSGQKEI